MGGLLSLHAVQTTPLPLLPSSTYKGKTFIVTGSNTGLGYECAKHLITFGAARVILAVRSATRGSEALSKIDSETGITGVGKVWSLDLSSYESVLAFAEKAKGLERIDGVIENASIAKMHWDTTEDLEATLTVNVISTYLLAVLILPKLKEVAKKEGIVPVLTVVGSGVGFMGTEGELEGIPGEAEIFEFLNDEKKMSVGGNRYGLSKLLQTYATRQLASLLPASNTDVVINYLSPGLCITNLDRSAGFSLFKIQLWVMRRIMGRTAEMGSRTLLHAVAGGKDTHGKYLSECEVHEDMVPDWVTNSSGAKVQERVWKDLSARLEKLAPGCVERALKA